MGNPVEGVKQWLVKVALKKAITRAIPYVITGIVGIVMKANAVGGLAGVQISVDEAALGAAVASALTVGQNWLKTKFNLKWL
jgi:hypothetical protein